MDDARCSRYAVGMSNKPLSRILFAALFTAAVDFVSEANDERKRARLRET